MNKKDMVLRLSQKSGVGLPECQKVLDALEETLNEELASSKSFSDGFDKIYKLISFFKGKK